VCATPLNAFTVSSHLKNVLDPYPAAHPVALRAIATGTVRNALRFPEKNGPKRSPLSWWARSRRGKLAAVRAMFSLYANAMSMELLRRTHQPESYLLQFSLPNRSPFKAIEAAYVKAGYELATLGGISPDTQEGRGRALSPDVPISEKYPNIYWNMRLRWENNRANLDLLSKIMFGCAHPDAGNGPERRSRWPRPHLKPWLQFDFPDKQYSVHIASITAFAPLRR